MNLPPIICANCGRTYDLPEHLSHGPCVACGTINCRPQAEGESLDKLQRATRLRLEGNHGEALRCYEHVLVDFDDEHTALWGKLLCQYGVEFVTDPKTGVRHATVHVPQSRPMQLHADFSRACELAPEEVRAQYEADAAYVDEALAEINRHKESSPPYDVFICHKTTHLTGPGYTEDYNRGVQLTMLLTGMGYRVFFAPLSGLTPGASYEAGIYYALWSAKVMLLISSDVAFLTSPWVKSEWTRYLEMLDDGAGKHLVPLMYDRLSDSRMPKEIRLRGLQSIRMDSDLDAKEKLLAALAKYTGKESPAPVQPVAEQPAAAPAPQPAPAPKAEPVRPQPAPARQHAPDRPKSEKPKTVFYTSDKDFETKDVDGGVAISKYIGPGGTVSIPPTIRGKRVVEIGDEAFEDCEKVQSVVVPEGVRKLGDYAFHGCTDLHRAQLPDSLEEIGWMAFWNCGKLEEIRIPAKVTAGPETINWFVGCTGLQRIIPAPGSKLQVRDGVLFNGTGCLVAYPPSRPGRSYAVPAGTKELVRRAFDGCGNLEEITLPDSLTKVSMSCFEDCANLKKLELPDGMTYIDDWAFSNCGVPVLTVPRGADVSGDAFSSFSGLLRVFRDSPAHKHAVQKKLRHEVIGETVVKPAAKPAATAPAIHFDAVPVNGGVSVTKYTGKAAKVEIPAVIGGKPVVEIGEEAFEACIQMQEVVIPEGVRKLGDYAFNGCTGLRRVQLPDSLEEIGWMAFWNCGKLEEIRIPAKVTAGPETINWFVGCTSLQRITTAPGAKLQVRDGVLFNGTGCLVAYPPSRPGRSYAVPAGTKELVRRAFDGYKNLEEITLPTSLTRLSMSCFEDCTNLKKLELPDGTTYIDDFAFENCGVAVLTIPRGAGVSDVAFTRFNGLLRVYRDSPAHKLAVRKELRHEVIGETAVKPVTIPAANAPASSPESHFEVATITGGVSVKKYTGPGGEVVIPATIGGRPVVEIGNKAFKECKTLKKVEIPEGVKMLYDSAFHTCAALHTVRLPDSLELIDDSVFWNCGELTDVRIPDRVTQIGSCAFRGCSKLPDIHVPSGVTSIGFGAFTDCLALRKITVADNNGSFYAQDGVLLSRRGTLVAYPCGREAAEYTIPDGVNSLGHWSFYGARKLQRVNIPQSVKILGNNGFEHCSSLVSVRIPDGVKEIPGALFDGCSSLREVYIPETVTRIGSFAFDGCSQLTSLTIPAGVSDFDKYAIERCPKLTLRVHENSEAHKYAQEKGLQFEVIGKTAASEPEAPAPRRPRRPAISEIGAADSCYQVTPVTGGVSITKYTGPGGEVTIPATIGGNKVVEIGNGAFKACTTLTVAVIPEGVTHIGKDAFHGCSSLRSVAIPKGVTDIGPSAFYGCRSLTIAELPDSVKSIGLGAFDRCSSLISMRIPERVTTIGDFAFCSCTSLRSVSIPESVKSIGYGAFAECRSLQDLALPRRLPVIGENAFKNCPLSLGVRMKLKFAPQPK